jgi:hypothetical protein
MILFLDFDGVLHPFAPKTNPSGAKDFRFVPKLEDVLREYPEVEIVVTSSRRLTNVLLGLRRIFAADIAPRVVGTTPSMPYLMLAEGQRQAEVEAWLAQNNRSDEPWVALDDRADFYRPDAPLILCQNGLSPDNLVALRNFLAPKNE